MNKLLKKLLYTILLYVVGFIFTMVVFTIVSVKHYEKLHEDVKIDDSSISDYIFINKKGDPVKISDHKGKYVLIDFWFSGCKPCIEAMPSLAKLATRYHDQLDVISISIENLDHMNTYLIKHPVVFPIQKNMYTYNIGYDTKKWEILESKLKLHTYPSYIIIDKDGSFVSKPLSQLVSIVMHKAIGGHLSFEDYIINYKKVLPSDSINKYLILYTIILFAPTLIIYLLVLFLIRLFKRRRRLNISKL